MSIVHIVGGGAIGSLLAAGAQKHGVTYRQYPRTIESCPSIAYWVHGEEITLNKPYMTPSVLNTEDVLVIPLKVYQLSKALHYWQPYLANKPTVVLLHNGMGGAEVACELLGSDYPLLLATTSHGALKRQTSESTVNVEYTGKGATQIGLHSSFSIGLTDKLQNAIALLTKVLPPVDYCENMEEALWAKLSINAVINPLTALHNMQNKGILNSVYDEQRQAICAEFVATANAYGFNFNEQLVQERVETVARATGENYSSMHQDIVNQRKSEIDAINGYIVKKAKAKGIAVPMNASLWAQINNLEQKHGKN